MPMLNSNLNRLVTKIKEAQLPNPAIIGVDGYLGSGKSRLAQALATALNAAHVDARNYESNPSISNGESPLLDFYDWHRLERELFHPFCAGSPLRIATQENGERVIKIVHSRPYLIVDGPFLCNLEHRKKFHFWVFVDVNRKMRRERFVSDHKSLDEFNDFEELENLHQNEFYKPELYDFIHTIL